MIQLLSVKYSKHIACILASIFLCSLVPVYGRGSAPRISRTYYPVYNKSGHSRPLNNPNLLAGPSAANPVVKEIMLKKEQPVKTALPVKKIATAQKTFKADIGGPSQPEMSSFKSVGTDNMVNLFTGDFSYNIPLLDVGGYPVNLFYDCGISMEQEASWVGLGWNINPGTVSRNMRGVPDDFNGDDILTQTQTMKPNKTWGVTLNGDLELVGIKDVLGFSVGASVGISFNNYLGPALDLGLKGGTNFTIAGKAGSEKTALKAGIGLGANINSRSGLTLSPNVSLTASSFANVKGLSTGLSLATSYNSKSGIKALQISEQMSYNYNAQKRVWHDDKGNALWKDGVRSSMGGALASTTISFAKPSYVPAVRMPLNNEAYAGHFQIGGGIWGVYGSAEVEVFSQKSTVAYPVQKKQLVGYMYYQKAKNNPNAVLDFTRLNDNEVTSNTPVISAPQYSYDVFTIQGEGTGGSIRAYRNDMGYMRDNTTRSKDNSLSIGADIGIPGHFGANVNTIRTPTVISEWVRGNKLTKAIGFTEASGTYENVYFRNPGETSVLLDNQWNRIGGTDLVRFKLGGTNASPSIEPVLERFSKSNSLLGTTNVITTTDPTERKKRSQVTSFLTAEEAALVGLDADIKSYNTGTVFDNGNILQYTSIPRVDVAADGYRKKHHLSQITVTEPAGKRYVYGIPVYNTIQKDFSFTVTQSGTDDDKVNTSASEATSLNSSSDRDGYLQITETPGYAHSFLLTGLLSTDYVDVTNNGITEDDLGDAVKFNYTRVADHIWRTPHTSGSTAIANFNAGNRTETKDDKGIISYGKRESWYLHSIESKLMIALFTLEDRADGKGPVNEFNGVNSGDNSLKRLKKIDLYNKADIKKNGLANAKPVKTVWFSYSYSLCPGTPDNASGGGKLTLDSVYFTFNGKDRINKNKYAFAYTNGGAGNPAYAFNVSDRWGTYKPRSQNPGQMKNSDYPYTIQDSATSAQNAAAWSLKKILLPSGGQIEVEYESDDYAFIQNKRAANMMEIAGLGSTATTITNKLYGLGTVGSTMGIYENDYVFIKVPEACTTRTEVFNKYLTGVNQLAFKLAVNMPRGVEYINCYGTIEDYGVYDASKIWVKLNTVNNLSPLSLSALSYLRERLPGQAFPGYDVSESSGLKQIGEMLLGMLDALKSAFKDPVMYLRSQGKAQTIIAANSFVRLNDPDGFKYGGGQRVKSVKLKDNWQAMTGQYTSEYGQVYNYTTTEVFNGVERTISSGVASYEPSIGGEENPFQSIVQVTNKLPMGPASYGAIEMPVLDALFPAPSVGYSKVTVKSINKNTDATKKSRSGIGKQVTEFYTAKDFPVYYNHTSIDPGSDKQDHQASLLAFFYKYAFDSRALSQGFIIETNDMHGKMRSQASYAENDEKNRVNYTENFYRNTGSKGLNDKFDFVYASQGGIVQQGNMGIDVELMTDTREFSVKSTSLEIQGQVDLFPVIIPIWLPFIWPVSGESENTYRAVTTTKVINYHGILDSVVVIDKGSQTSTKNQVYDAETGDVMVTRTNNEFDKPIYTVKYPAWWAYSGMGLAYKNMDAIYSGINFYDGRMMNGSAFEQAVIESGDELYIMSAGSGSQGCVPASTSYGKRIWAFDKNKNNTSLTVTSKDLMYLDANGNVFTQNGVRFRIVRSGKRNMLDATATSVVMMTDPVATVAANTQKLVINSSSNVIGASSADFFEKWQIDNELIKKFRLVFNASTCEKTEVEDCTGHLQKRFNPYVTGMLGNFRNYRSLEFYGERTATMLPQTNLSQDGFLSNFQLYWNFDGNNNLVPDMSSTKWVWKDQVTRVNIKGMELETKNALNIYTAAQYGYHRTLPIAVTSNSPYDETAYEGFEDNSYAEALNTISVNSCTKKHIDLTSLANTQVVSSESTGIAAHTGKYMLAVNGNSSAGTTFNIKTATTTDYSLSFGSKSSYSLTDQGLNFDAFEKDDPDSWVIWTPNHASLSGTSDNMDLWAGHPQPPGGYRALIRQSSYFEVAQNGNNSVYLSAAVSNLMFTVSAGAYIYDVDGNLIAYYWTTPPGNAGTANDPFGGYVTQITEPVFLCKGVYRIEVLYSILDTYVSAYNPGNPHITFRYGLNNGGGVAYKTYAPDNGCITTLPMAASQDMLNPVFTPPASKKMVLSAWVREQCATCITYANNQINIGGTMLKPEGPIIDGWQRFEGEFTPASGGQVTLSLVNNSSSTIYFDDIRIHPYNANMKSYVYDPVNLRLLADLDPNNYATYYEYDEEGGLVRTKVETKEGIKTINETRSFQQRGIQQIQ